MNILKLSDFKGMYATPKVDIQRRAIYSHFLDLLEEVKKNDITVNCGIRVLNLISGMSNYDSKFRIVRIAQCEITTELDFTIGSWDVVYEGQKIIEE